MKNWRQSQCCTHSGGMRPSPEKNAFSSKPWLPLPATEVSVRKYLKDWPLGQRILCVILELGAAPGGFDEETGRDRAGTISSLVRRGRASEKNHLRRNPPIGSGHCLLGESWLEEVTNKNNNRVVSPGEKGREL